MKRFTRMPSLLIAVAVVAVVGAPVALAAKGSAEKPARSGKPAKPAKPGKPGKPSKQKHPHGSDHFKRPNPEKLRAMHQEYVKSLADKLGVTTEQVEQAIKATHKEQIEKALAEGKISQELADHLLEQIEAGNHPMFGPRIVRFKGKHGPNSHHSDGHKKPGKDHKQP
jgi:hypothetical protein